MEKMEKNDKNFNWTAEERKELEKIKNQLAGTMLHDWLPADPTRKVIMLVILVIGLYGIIIKENILYIFIWLLLPAFSPRIVGKTLFFMGRIKGFLNRLFKK